MFDKLNSLTTFQLITIARELSVLRTIKRSFSDEITYNVKIDNFEYLLVQTYKEALVYAIANALR